MSSAVIDNVILPNEAVRQRFKIELSNGKISSITSQPNAPPSPPILLLPALCHPHIHLDKANLLTSHPKPGDDYPDYSDLALEKGDFQEALRKTAQAKGRYTIPDLILRGSQLIVESIQAGVTSMRAFVEVDNVTQVKCLEAAIELKQKFKQLCHVQICAFAQDPIMSGEHGEENRQLMEQALEKYSDFIEVLGTTPYVEDSVERGQQNLKWAIETGLKRDLHLDFHIDYNVKSDGQFLTLKALEMLKQAERADKAQTGKRIVFGHCTRMTTLTENEMQDLADKCASLPVAFVGLPSSDLFMMGRPNEGDDRPHRRERGTMQVVDMIQKHNLEACIGINNAGNAFTPWGNADPLRLASLGVGLYQAGTAEQARILYECVSTRARRAIGLQGIFSGGGGEEGGNETRDDFDLVDADVDGVLVVMNEANLHLEGLSEPVPARQRVSVTDVVWDPPEYRLRRILGRV